MESETLQKEFMALVNKMIENNVSLPEDFELTYLISEHSDRRGTVIHICPCLTKEEAIQHKQSDNESVGKYWSKNHHTIVNYNNIVDLENFETHNYTKFEADYQIKHI